MERNDRIATQYLIAANHIADLLAQLQKQKEDIYTLVLQPDSIRSAEIKHIYSFLHSTYDANLETPSMALAPRSAF